MKSSLKIASTAIGLALFTGAAIASAQMHLWNNTAPVTVTQEAGIGTVQSVNAMRAVVATTTVAASSSPVSVSGFNVILVPAGSITPSSAVAATSAMPMIGVLYVQSTARPSVAVIPSASCSALTSFMKAGAANKPAEVLKLQAFLKNNQKLDVDQTGIFDAKTEAGVMAFQRAYMNDIMGPWGATRPSGIVHVTTLKKINELACGTQLSLNGADMSLIAAYKNASVAAEAQNAATGSTVAVIATGTDMAGPSMGSSSNTAAAGDISFMGRFWRFLGNIFQ